MFEKQFENLYYVLSTPTIPSGTFPKIDCNMLTSPSSNNNNIIVYFYLTREIHGKCYTYISMALVDNGDLFVCLFVCLNHVKVPVQHKQAI